MENRAVVKHHAKYDTICDGQTDDTTHDRLEFDSSKRGWFVCLVSMAINAILFGICSCQGIHYLVMINFSFVKIHQYWNYITFNRTFTFKELREIFNSTRLELLPLAGSTLPGITYLACPLIAVAMETFGCPVVMMTGSIISGTAMLLSGLIGNNFWLYTVMYGLVNGLGLSCMFLPALTSIGYYFEKRVSMAVSLAYTGCSFGYVILPPLEEALIKKFGLHSTLIIEGTLAAAMFPLACILPGLKEVRKREKSISRMKENPPREPYSSLEPSLSLSLTVSKPKVDWCILKSAEFWIYMTSQVFSALSEWAPMGILPRVIKKLFDASTGQSLAGLLITTYGISSLFGRVPMGALADLPSMNALILQAFSGLLVSVMGFLQSATTEYWLLCLLSGIKGVFVPVISLVNPSIVLDIWGIERLPMVLGFVKFSRGIGFVLGPILLNMVMDEFGERAGLYSAAGFHLGGSAFALVCYVVNKKTSTDVFRQK